MMRDSTFGQKKLDEDLDDYFKARDAAKGAGEGAADAAEAAEAKE
jgi:hypothetical protein